MKPVPTRLLARLATTMLCIALIAAAFLRGNYLLGPDVGIFYAIVAGLFLWFGARAFARDDRASLMLIVAISLLISIPIGLAMTFPAAVNPDVGHFIDKQATDRSVRAELKHVFGSDPDFRRLSISTTHLKVVNVTIRGPLAGRRDLDRLRERAINECPTLELCPLHWDVTLRDTKEHIDGLDRELFPAADEAGQPGGE